MKKKHLNTLKIASLTLMLGCFAVGGVYNHYQEEQQDNVIKVERKVQPKYASYNDDDYEITLTANELNNYIWTNLANYFNEGVLNFDSSYVSYDDNDYSYNEYIQQEYVQYSYNEDSVITFNIEDESEYFGTWYTYVEDVKYDFSSEVVWVIPSAVYSDIKSAIELDIQANQPASMGESIVGAITSGLGLIPDLASEFLTGFSTLFWDSTNSTLTNFSTFALVFLGIAITMAVIKLVLAIIRGSTGA